VAFIGFMPFAMRLDLEPVAWRYVMAVLFLGIFIEGFGLLYLDRSSVTIREYLTQRTRAALGMTIVLSIPLWLMAMSQSDPKITAVTAGLTLLIIARAVSDIRCPRCKSYLGLRTGLAIAFWKLGGHMRIDYCESCQVLFDEPRKGPKREPVDD
jgi:hypothetical protein